MRDNTADDNEHVDVKDQDAVWAMWLRQCQENLGEVPRSFDADTTAYLQIDGAIIFNFLFFVPICKLLKNSRQRDLFRNGKVVWGHVIQANDCLWMPDTSPAKNDDAPGELVFACDSEVNPPYLERIATKLASLRGDQHEDPDLARIGNYLEAETKRVFGWSVPKSVSPDVPCYISTTMFLRKHLPDTCLHRSFFPIVISPKRPHFAMSLPERFWPAEFLTWWKTDEKDEEARIR